VSFIHALREFYGLQPTPPSNLFQFLVWEILSQDSVPARRDLAWHALRKIPALTPDATFRAPAKELLDAVGLAGPHREEKLEQIRATAGEIKRHRDLLDADALKAARLLSARRALARLEHLDTGIQRRALLFSAGYLTMPVDAAIGRVVSRLVGEPIASPAGPPSMPFSRDSRRAERRARVWLVNHLPHDVDAFRDAVVYLRHHAQHTCVPIGPHCHICPLRDECQSVERRDTST